MSIEITEVGHRDSRLRKVQNKVAFMVPALISAFDYLGAFPNTKIHTAVRSKSERLKADDVTLSQLQMTVHICKMIEENKFFPNFGFEYVLTSFLNGADGIIARRLNSVTKEGGIKDASVDRLSEVMIARLLSKKLNLPEETSHRLEVAFQLSTLTKAACEMSDVKTSEGGIGSMIQRRIALYFILRDLITLNAIPKSMKQLRENKVIKINQQINKLIEDSFNRAKERINLIAENVSEVKAPKNKNSSGASEAIKYAGVVLINNLIGLDIVTELNNLAEGSVVFPTVPNLMINQRYIFESLTNAKGYIDDALAISGLAKKKI